MRAAVLSLLAFGVIGDVAPAAHAVQTAEHPKLSPFTGVRMRGEAAEVRLDETWYELVSLDGIAAADILAHCRKTYRDRWEKRFAEDLVEVLAGMDQKTDASVDLVLKDLSSGARIERARVPMTEANRRRVRDERNVGSAPPSASAPRGSAPARRVERDHAEEIAPAYAFLAESPAHAFPADMPRLARPQAEQDLDQLEWHLEHEYSYRDLRGVDWQAALDAIRASLPESIALGDLGLRLTKLLALAGDGHSRLDLEVDQLVPGGYAPFLVGDTGTALVAFRPDRSDFADPKRPRLLALDGRPIEDWISAGAELVARGSPSFARARAVRALRFAEVLRGELGLPLKSRIELELAALDGSDRRTLALDLSDQRPTFGAWPRRESALLDGRIGYLRLASMDGEPAFLDALDSAMERCRDARGLVIDVRGNGGGSRLPLVRLLPYFLAPADAPRIASVAAVRLAPDLPKAQPEGYLEDRFAWPLSSARWTPPERAAIERAAEGFAPSWPPPAADFSEWHWLVLTRAAAARAFHFDRPVVLLQDGACFSATDIFLGAFQGAPRVTLLGTTSGGGSGRARSVALAHSGLALRLSSMASFRPDGSMYDGRGVAPDVLVHPAAADFLGRGDAQLDAALARLR